MHNSLIQNRKGVNIYRTIGMLIKGIRLPFQETFDFEREKAANFMIISTN